MAGTEGSYIMSFPLLSIIIPYAGQVDINPLIDSIPIHLFEVEIILVDDRRDEFDISMKRLCKAKGHQYIRNLGKIGAGACRNLGLQIAKGKFVLFADDDDMFIKGAFDFILKDVSNQENDIYFYIPSSVKEDGNIGSRHQFYENLIINYLNGGLLDLRYRYHVPWSKVYRKDFILKNSIAFDEVIASNDVFFSIRCGYLAESIFVSEKKIYCVSERSNSLTKQNTKEKVLSRLKVYMKTNRFLYEKKLKEFQLPLLYYLFVLCKLNFFLFVKVSFFVLLDLRKQKILPDKLMDKIKDKCRDI